MTGALVALAFLAGYTVGWLRRRDVDCLREWRNWFAPRG